MSTFISSPYNGYTESLVYLSGRVLEGYVFKPTQSVRPVVVVVVVTIRKHLAAKKRSPWVRCQLVSSFGWNYAP